MVRIMKDWNAEKINKRMNNYELNKTFKKNEVLRDWKNKILDN
jgi:hypothetical protein